MKKIVFLIFFVVTFSVFAQVQDDFSDGDFTNNPVWSGMTENFTVNSNNELQSNAQTESKSYLTTPSLAVNNATWEVKVRIDTKTSASNYISIYIMSDRADLSGSLNGYYVQIGGTKDDISLYRQKGSATTKRKIIDGTDKTVDINPVELIVRVTRDDKGTFKLYRKLPTDSDFVLEGEAVDDNITSSSYFGLLFANSKSTGEKYFFDDVVVKGEKVEDKTAPAWTKLLLEEPNKLVLEFSEEIDFSEARFQVDNGVGEPIAVDIANDKTAVTLTFANHFQKGMVYTVDVMNIKDTSGNLLAETQKRVGIVGELAVGDIVINEILPNPEKDIPEYFEIYNTSDKVLDLSSVRFGVRNKKGEIKPAYHFPEKTLLLPKGYLAVTTDADLIRKTYKTPNSANIVSVEKIPALSNASANLAVVNEDATLVYDEVNYSEKWHTVMIRNPKGVALEKINPALPTNDATSWHSASTDSHYGTPGYQNSQYRELNATVEAEKWVWVTPEAFTPDNDGVEDVCFIHYKTDAVGYTANVMIFNAVGVLVKKLAANVVLGMEGNFIWDGNTDDGKIVNAGIYVLYFEMINTKTGVKKVEKLPLVVSLR